MPSFRDKIGSVTVDGSWWIESGFTSRYAAQFSCPFKDCESFYTAQNYNTEGRAKSAAKNKLRSHINKKHK